MNEYNNPFLKSIDDRIESGEFDKSISIFVPKKLIYSAIKSKVEKKISNGGSPMLTESEVKDAIKDAKEVGEATAKLFLDIGIIKKTDNGLAVNEKLQKILKNL